MSDGSTPERAQLSTIRLLPIERDMVRQALDCLMGELAPAKYDTDFAVLFSKSFTLRRLTEVRALFEDKPQGSAS